MQCWANPKKALLGGLLVFLLILLAALHPLLLGNAVPQNLTAVEQQVALNAIEDTRSELDVLALRVLQYEVIGINFSQWQNCPWEVRILGKTFFGLLLYDMLAYMDQEGAGLCNLEILNETPPKS